MLKKNNKVFFINIFLVIFVFCFLLYLKKIYPFGTIGLAKGDGLSQFKPMIYNFLYRIRHLNFSPYSFNNGLGNPVLFNYLYYSSSLVNLLVIFIKDVEIMYFSIILIKLVITSITMTHYVKSKTNNNYYIIISVLSYTFCSWLLTYFFLLSWLDIFMMFPLLQYGLEKLLNKGSNKIYILSLAYIVSFSFSFAYTIIFYIFFYSLIVILFYIKKGKIKVLINLLKSTLIVLFVAFFYLFALYDTLGKMGYLSDPFVKNYYTNFSDIFVGLIYGNYNYTYHLFGHIYPNIAVNIIIIINCLCFFVNKRIKVKDKIIALLSIIALFVCLKSQYINFCISGFHNVRGYPYRYVFIIVFLIIKMFIINVKNTKFDKIDKKKTILCSIIVLILVFLLRGNEFYNNKAAYISLIIIISYIIYIALYNNYKHYNFIILFLFVINILIIDNNFSNEYRVSKSFYDYKEKDSRYRTSTDSVVISLDKQIENAENDNVSLYTNDKTVDLFSSMTYGNVVYLLGMVGEDTLSNSYVRSSDENLFSAVIFNKKQAYYLEKIYSVNKDIENIKLNKEKIIENIEDLSYNMANVKNVLKHKKVEGIKNEYGGYSYHTGVNYSIFKGTNNGKKTEFMIKGEELFSVSGGGAKVIDVYYYDEEKINDIYEVLKKNQIRYSKYEDSHIIGEINVDKNQIIFTSIPYDTNWDIYLDGKKVKPIKILDSLIGIEAKEGKHTLEMKYSNRNLIIPALISIISIILVIRKKR